MAPTAAGDVLDGVGALVTGGGSGIGLASARHLRRLGARVTICGRTLERLEQAAKDATSEPGPQFRWAVADVVDEEAVAAAVSMASDGVQHLGVVVACAGGSAAIGPLATTARDAWQRTVDVNLTGTFLTLKHAAPHLAAQGGSFVAISSIAGLLTHRFLGAYNVAKAGIEMLVRVAADELGASGVRVNAVAPGLVDTDLAAALIHTDAVREDYLTQMPLARVGTVDDIAEAIAWLATPASSWVTGQILRVDGGHSLRRGPDYTGLLEPVFGSETLARGVAPR